MKLAIVSSPRSGNTWFRSVLSTTLGLPTFAVHNYLDVPESMPEDYILQIHWPREPNFQKWLAERRITVITITRHPLDILLSCLNFVQHEPETCRWIGGNTGLPQALLGVKPNSEEFMNYALGFEFGALLSVTYDWLHDKQALAVRYESLLADGEAGFIHLLSRMNLEASVTDGFREYNFEYFKTMPNHHGWLGTSCNYKRLLLKKNSDNIYNRHVQIFQKANYQIENYDLSENEAAENWAHLRV